MIYALIKNNVVENTIVADEIFINNISSQYDFCIRIDNISTPNLWTKDGEQDLFEQPMIDEVTSDPTWTLVPGIRQPGVGWSYSGSNFSEPQE